MVKLTEKQRAELQALEAMSDDEIDLSDIPEREIDCPRLKSECTTSPTGRTSPSGWTRTS